MGTCFSKKKTSLHSSSSSSSATKNPHNPSSSVLTSFSAALASTAQTSTVVVPIPDPALNPKPETKPKKQQQPNEEQAVNVPAKKEVFLIKHRKSHDEQQRSTNPNLNSTPSASEQDDESEGQKQRAGGGGAQIRTSSCTKEEVDAILIQCGRLSRSSSGKAASSSSAIRRYSGSKRSFDFDEVSGKVEAPGEEEEKRERRRHSPSPQGRRRRTPSRERDRDRDRDSHQSQRSSSRERRVSRSPGRRGTAAAEPSPASESSSSSRPGKLVSVPATVTEKSNNNGSGEAGLVGSVKRISVKRNVGAASPRAQSPARAKPPVVVNEVPVVSLSRNSSRKAEISPFRRNPLGEIDSNRSQSRGRREIEGGDDVQAQKPIAGANHRNSNNKTVTSTVETTTVMISGADTKSNTVARTRSARRSRDFDFNSEPLLNPNTTAAPSYTRLLLEDINNFHQKNTSTTPVTLPACVTKACSILDAVADLNNNNNNINSAAFSEEQYSKTYNNLGGPKDPFMESEIGCDDLTEPSFHKYVTVRRGGNGTGVDGEDRESSGSNSVVNGSNLSNWGLSPSSWEPNSADSTDCWTSRSREDDGLCGRKRESNGSGSGIGRGRLGANVKGLHPAPVIADSTS